MPTTRSTSRLGVTLGESVDPKRPQVMVPLRGAQGRTLDLSRTAGPMGPPCFFGADCGVPTADQDRRRTASSILRRTSDHSTGLIMLGIGSVSACSKYARLFNKWYSL